MKYSKNKNRNIYQLEILCQSQEFMPQVARRLYLFCFYVYEIDFYSELQKYDLHPFISVESEDEQSCNFLVDMP